MNPEQQTQTEPQTQPQAAMPPIHPEISKADKLGFVSIILGLTIVFALPGFIVGLVGASKSKVQGRSPKISRIGWILSLFVLVVSSVLLSLWLKSAYTDMQIDNKNMINDVTSKYELQKIQTELELHYSSGYGFPDNLAVLHLTQDDLTDWSNKPYKYSPKNCSKITTTFLESSSTLTKSCSDYTITAQLASTGKNLTLKSQKEAYIDAEKINENKIKKDSILEKVSKKIATPLPSNSVMVGIIRDVDTIKSINSTPNPERSSDAKNGDIEIYYINSDRSIIYRESNDKILYDGPFLGKPQTTTLQ